jgi:hypothetical protein
LTSFQDQTQFPALICYSALDGMVENSSQPAVISLPKTKAKKYLTIPNLIKNFIQNSQRSNLRSIIFVSRRDTTETRANEYVRDGNEIVYPEEALFDLARIKIERGVNSPFDEAFKYGIAPHHGSLPKIEQIFIERWIRKGYIKHVVATPTLAQGVNLPFDISIITFLNRYQEGENKDLSQAEVMNMLGRAGRAGMVSDGLALIAQQNQQQDSEPKEILDDYRKWFFNTQVVTDRFIGLSSILVNVLNDDFEVQDWIEELTGFDFNEAMSLNILLGKVCLQDQDGGLEKKLKEEIEKYPSINDLQSRVDDEDISAFFANKLVPIVTELSIRPAEILNAVALTGLPVEYIGSVIDRLRAVNLNEIEDCLDFANDVVEQSLSVCRTRDWFVRFRQLSPTKSFEFAEGFNVIKKWVSGVEWNALSTEFQGSFEGNLIYTGSFLNNIIPQIAQFWGCLAVCEKILFGSESHYFDLLQPFIRNGINSKQKFILLKELGFNDRVLAHRIARYLEFGDEDNIADIQKNVRQQLKAWKTNLEILPAELSLDEIMALKSILGELYFP